MTELPKSELAIGAAPPIPRAYWVLESSLAGGPYPGDAAVLASLLEMGFTAFVDLTEASIPGSGESRLPDYGRLVRRADPSLVTDGFPVADFMAPAPTTMGAILDRIDTLIGEGHTVYVHCLGGVGRTGSVIGCWLVRHGYAGGDTVLDTLGSLRGRPGAPEADEQRALVTTWPPGR